MKTWIVMIVVYHLNGGSMPVSHVEKFPEEMQKQCEQTEADMLSSAYAIAELNDGVGVIVTHCQLVQERYS